MKLMIRYLLLGAVVAMTGSSVFAADSSELAMEAQRAISMFKQNDPGIQQFFNNAAGYAVFPKAGKGGLIIGGSRGKGIVFQNGQMIGEAALSSASIGLQAGGQTFDEVIFFETPSALQNFKSGNLSLSARASGVVARTGAAANARYVEGTAVFVQPISGVMGEAAIGGQKFSFRPFAVQQP